MLNELRYRLVIGFAILLFIWPVAHIGLSSYGIVNSWKLSGWGMYASTHPRDVGVNVYLIEADAPLSQLEVGPAVRTQRVVLFQNGETQPLETEYLTRNSKVVQYLQVMPTHYTVQTIVDQLNRRLPADITFDYALILRTEPRVNLFDGYAYTITTVYAVRNGEVFTVGEYSTATLTLEEILAQIEAEMAGF